VTITPEREKEIEETRQISHAANAYLWGVFDRQQAVYTPREKWDMDAVKRYLKDYVHSRQRFDEKLERYLTPDDKKQIDKIIRRRLEIIITGQEVVEP